MIGYVTLGTNDLPRAAAFYDALLAEIGAKRLYDFGRAIAWGTAMDKPALSATLPFDGKPATVGNGVMVALVVDSKEKVARVHAKALELGGKDEGPVGPRGDGFYAGYFRDLDGNKLNVFCMG
ncbi:MAG: VOC family protein [Betaproteobacteria bacterium]|jgi:catechol 2,3-dioxygenase-like lactoylglutathione lyase family enzyme|nr:VOC family protein [Betaproteobacteria bacterium]